MSVLRSYGSNRGLFLLTGKKGSGEAVLIKSGKILIGKKHIEKRRKTKMKSDNLNGPGNITKGLGIDDTFDGYNLLTGIIDLSPRIHPLDQAIS